MAGRNPTIGFLAHQMSDDGHCGEKHRVRFYIESADFPTGSSASVLGEFRPLSFSQKACVFYVGL